ncbi:glycoside hydrolase [Fomitopsis serialis]|uniref:glycoside hydrolase n=1 Tax=Fomitopsis serialis TaxID=139415 RepID=UPI0020078D19|nr:glycoside hydrolase [Neoantrodia serialis]KAH9936318.1 glycoside hydrolase [Neoantrodia serialis]
MHALALIHFLVTVAALFGAAAKRDDSGKLVVAHVIVGNTYPYTIDNWTSDIQLASDNGIDGFALNVGPTPGSRIALLTLSGFDLGTRPRPTSGSLQALHVVRHDGPVLYASSDAATLRNYITSYATHPNQLLVNGQVFASTFSGSDCTSARVFCQGWNSQFISQLTGQNAVHFVPSFFSDTSAYSEFDGVMDGTFNWNGGWPVSLTVQSAQSAIQGLGSALGDATFTAQLESVLNSSIGTFSTDQTYISALNAVSGDSKTYMASVSPWFFTHYPQSSYNKNWLYLMDNQGYNTRWETLISNRDSVDIVEIVTWNDYGESSYIGPVEGAQPQGTTWATGFDHTGWLAMTKYYATAFKTGAYPAITQDQLFMWARPHPKDAQASNDGTGPPTSYQLTEDALWAVAFTTQPATVALTTGSGTTQTVDVPAGVTRLSMPLTAGAGMAATMTRGGAAVLSVSPGADAFTFNPNPQTYNFNAFVAYATANGTTS